MDAGQRRSARRSTSAYGASQTAVPPGSASGAGRGPPERTETALRIRTRDGEERAEPAVHARTAVDRAFVDVLAGRPPSAALVAVPEALHTHRLAWAIAEATRSGAAVRPAGR